MGLAEPRSPAPPRRAREVHYQEDPETFTLAKEGADGSNRELFMQWLDEDGYPPKVGLTVFWESEHCNIPLDPGQARRVAAWLAARVGMPPGSGWVHESNLSSEQRRT